MRKITHNNEWWIHQEDYYSVIKKLHEVGAALNQCVDLLKELEKDGELTKYDDIKNGVTSLGVIKIVDGVAYEDYSDGSSRKVN